MGLHLALDTSSDKTFVALGEDETLLAASESEQTGAHSEELGDMVARVFERAGRDLASLERIIVGLGPGSFTGLRIGLSFAKGLAHGSGAVVRGIPSFLGAAFTNDSERVAVIQDARRGEVFFASFLKRDSVYKVEKPECILTPSELLLLSNEYALDADRKTAWLTLFSLQEQIPVQWNLVRDLGSGLLKADASQGTWSTANSDRIEALASLVPIYVREVAAKKIAERTRSGN